MRRTASATYAVIRYGQALGITTFTLTMITDAIPKTMRAVRYASGGLPACRAIC